LIDGGWESEFSSNKPKEAAEAISAEEKVAQNPIL